MAISCVCVCVRQYGWFGTRILKCAARILLLITPGGHPSERRKLAITNVSQCAYTTECSRVDTAPRNKFILPYQENAYQVPKPNELNWKLFIFWIFRNLWYKGNPISNFRFEKMFYVSNVNDTQDFTLFYCWFLGNKNLSFCLLFGARFCLSIF